MPSPRLAIAAPHPLAVDAARTVAGEGGNAVDAAVAAAAALTVVYPHQCAIGGDLFALVRHPGGAITAINASGAYGTGGAVPTSVASRGPSSVSVPGLVSGWDLLLEVAGSLPPERLLAPAIAYAETGVPVGERLARAIAKLLPADHVSADLRALLDTGDLLRQPALARTLTDLATDGLRSFYDGRTGDRIAAACARLGIPIVREDLRRHRPVREDPLTAQVAGARVSTARPNSQGYLLLTTLRALDALPEADPGVLAELFAYGEARREAELADPDHMTADVEELVAARSIERDLDVLAHRRPVADGDTVAVTALADDGTAVSLIQSLYSSFGSGVHDADTGITFHNRAAGFSGDPASPNVIAPGKRPAHTLMPVLVEHPDGTVAALGAMGGSAQPQIHVQLLRHLRDGSSPQEAVSAPRFAVAIEPGTGARIARAEADLGPATLATLRAAALDVQEIPAHDESVGHAMVCIAAPDGTLTAGSDPRSDGGTWVSS